jgi:tetratricopeptide (TPR) repeat protein
MDLCFQGMAYLNKGQAPEDVSQAAGFFDRALALQPNNVDALAASAWLQAIVATSLITTDRAARLAAAEAATTKALSLAPNHAFAHVTLAGPTFSITGPYRALLSASMRSALDRNLAAAHAYIGVGKLTLGRAEETESHILEALRLSPRDAVAYHWMFIAGAAKLQLGSDEEAIAWLRRSIQVNRNTPLAHYLAAALAHLSRLDDARTAVQAGLAIDPAFTIARWRNIAMSDNPTFLAQRGRIRDGVRKAGVPEG